MKENQPSTTAENLAAVRAFEAMRPQREQICSDVYARRFLSDRFTRPHNLMQRLFRVLDGWETVVPGVCGSILARTRFIDDCLANAIENNIGQLVILGAGYDTRALRFEALKEKVKVFEIDHPETQQYKLERLKDFSADLDGYVTYIPIDFEEKDFGKELLSHGYNKELRTFFIWEGVTYYLSEKAVDDTLSFIARNSKVGNEIVFDYFPASIVAGACEVPEAGPLFRILKNFGERIRFGIWPEKIADFLNERGFEIVQNLGSDDYKEAYFKEKTGLGRTVSRLFFFVHATVARSITTQSPRKNYLTF